MSMNPYAPPKSLVADVEPPLDSRPALWNPWAATLWSLVFSPAFGAYLHMKNWRALGDAEKARVQKLWFIGSLTCFTVLSLAGALLPDLAALKAVSKWIFLPLLLAWYYLGGKAQRAYIEARFGKDYSRRGWLKPLGAVFLIFVALVVVAGLAAFALKSI